ncbi:ubiquitin carboxyl-terminal hydrolase 28 isoform X11 [Tiliqua scincoides]|uniref:ubiquitin carboxyl-terminal hydrolase 28 isoform X11 n=1 Tax=Tiliqua scincoides TaxID=71010 RepID=UPI00346324C9
MTAELQQAQEGGAAGAAAAESRARNCSVLLNQLREITGIQDPLFLRAALKAADGDLMQAVCFLTESHAKELGQEAVAAEPSDSEGSAVVAEQATSPTDATPDNDADLQEEVPLRPVKDFPNTLAMEKGPSATVNIRAQEPSVTESKNRSKRKRCEVWGENTSQSEWSRVGEWPVGMKNIGNTCWFSAVIQSLFQLPEFRRLVLSYSLPNRVLENCQSRSKKRNIAFMQELQCLFALMLGTLRKFVDPSTALELLRGAFRSPEEQQQDVSEFTHKLLDWLEDAFQLAVDGSTSQDKSENPMVQLFYGTFLTEGIHEGKTFSKIETFGQYPLQVNGYKNLHECLEGAMVEGETEPSPSDQSAKYGQERWFTKLPPVLTFELSRFEFNQSLGQPEKIHNKLEFPQIIYMDRFLYHNKELIQAKREELKKLKDQITVLQQKLERYMKYGSGAGRFPLPDMLQYVLEFAGTKPPAVSPCDQTSTPAGPQATCQTSDSPVQSRVTIMQTESTEGAAPAVATPCQELVNNPLPSSVFPVEMPEYPAPRVITENEMSLVVTCLQRWRNEVEQDIKALKNSITLLAQSAEQMFSDPQLHQVPYHLHAVLVHEGQANAGHYWAYIYNQPRKSWLKYNDISVTEASWEELERDSFGGLRNASAYCLMYISEKLPHFAAVDHEDGQSQREVESLPVELQQYIQEDNWRLEQEMAEWEEQSCKMAQIEQSSASLESQYLSSDSGQGQPSPCEHEARSLSSEHAMIIKDQTAQAIAKTTEAYEKAGVEAAFQEAFHEEYSRLYFLSKESPTPQSDPRLQHVLVYLLQNDAPKQVVERTLLEQFADRNLSYDERSISIMKVARAKLKEIGPDDVDMEEYKKWHEEYSLFRKVSVYLLTGLELYQNEKYYEALTYLVYAYQCNMALLIEGPSRGADESLIALYRRKCLLKLNEAAAALFESSNERSVAEGVSILNEQIIPCMHLIINNNISQDDLDAIEVMRSRWCSYLGKDMNEDLQLKLGEFLPRLLDCSAEGVILKEPPKIRPNSPYDLCSRFAAVMESIHGASAVTVK